MAFLLIAPDRDPSELCAHLIALAPKLDLRIWPQTGDPAEIEFALAWKPPPGVFESMTQLRAVCSLGAGVDALVQRTDIPDHAAIARIAGPRLAADLAAYGVAMTVDWWKRLDEQRHSNRWMPLEPRPAPRVGLLGTGRMGQAAARAFRALDLQVAAWNRSGNAFPRRSAGTEDLGSLDVFHGPDGLTALVSRSDVVFNLLPLTPETRGILDRTLFEAMPDDSLLINAGRGEHLVEGDLLTALDRGRPGRAVLDVFETEPLADESPLRRHPGIAITPHVAARTDPREAAELAIYQWNLVRQGKPLPDAVDRSRGY